MSKLYATKRARGAIAALMAVSVGGFAMFGGARVHDDVALASETLVGPWEGRSLTAYCDPLTKPCTPTICDGDTANVKMGMVETPAGCTKRLVTRMEQEFRPALVACIADWDKKPLSWRAMMLALSWNIGTPTACRSTAARLGRAGLYWQSCQAATAFNKAGGQVRIGLVRRREMGDAQRIGEGELCVSGLFG